MAGGFAAEQKFDGHRAILFTPAGPGGRLFLQTRRGSLVQDRFPDLVSAAGQLPDGLVLDGELVVWDTAVGRLSFEALQRRAAARGRTATVLAAQTPAFFIAFDCLRTGRSGRRAPGTRGPGLSRRRGVIRTRCGAARTVALRPS
ncbi:hypothetical protein ACFCYH_29655 [Streptomyces sp. NPDC056400]|uniref:ATP-dependent DNA ligase n=1 Tax=Streptomyces sp. NPDC056400 TaxID=3345808 RepID=UPI0035DC5199